MAGGTRRCLTAVIAVLIYLFLLAAGAVLVCYYPISRQSEFVVSQATNIAAASTVDMEDAVSEAQTANIYILIYDDAGDLLRYEAPVTNLYNVEPSFNVGGQIHSVLRGESTTQVVLARETGRMVPDVLLLAGAPVLVDGAVTGAAFVGKNLMDIPSALIGFFIYFTICYWITIIVYLHSRRKERQLKNTEKNYVANMTHALKTPVASVKALAETLCDGVEPDTEKQQIYCGMILTEANRENRMIQDILNLSQLQSSRDPLPREPAEAGTVFDPVWEKYQLLMDCSGIHFHVSDTIEALPELYTNPAYVDQILEILLDNALKFTPEGGDIWVEAAVTGRRATICVRDNGAGIDSKDMPHIFDRFYKSGDDPEKTGNGLGLAIAREICERLHEKIWAESKGGEGADFFFTLRLHSNRKATRKS